MWKEIVKQATDCSIIRRRWYEIFMPGVYYKDAEDHSEYVILTDFLRQQWLRERSSLLLLHVRCLSL